MQGEQDDMAEVTVSAGNYDIHLERLLSGRLTECGCAYALSPEADGVRVVVKSRAGLESLADALSLMLCRDLQYYEVAHMADALPLPLADKQRVFREALHLCRAAEDTAAVRDGLLAYLEQPPPDASSAQGARRIHLEGYLRFRLQELTRQWEALVERAAAEHLFENDYHELMGMLTEYALSRESGAGNVAVCIKPDGSLTLTDESDACIEYVDCSEDGILSLLISMSPRSLTVYDISGGSGRRLSESIARVFAGRVRIYR